MQASPQEGSSNSLPDGLPKPAHVFLMQPHLPAHQRGPGNILELEGRPVDPELPANPLKSASVTRYRFPAMLRAGKPPARYPVANRVPVHPELIRQLANSNDYHDNSSIRSKQPLAGPGTAAFTESERPCRISSGIPSAWTASTRILTPAPFLKIVQQIDRRKHVQRKIIRPSLPGSGRHLFRISRRGVFPIRKPRPLSKWLWACRA